MFVVAAERVGVWVEGYLARFAVIAHRLVMASQHNKNKGIIVPGLHSAHDSFGWNEDQEECLVVLAAHQLAMRGELEQATSLLVKNGRLPKFVTGLDLLARIAVLQGDFARAKNLWQSVLAQEPDNVAALAEALVVCVCF